jgi:Domain of unknown function (DUF5666)
MPRSSALWIAVSLVAFLSVGCSSINKGNVGGGGGSSSQVSLTIRDFPPPNNISILSMQVTIVTATLQPGNVSLISSPQTVDLVQLQTDTAFLGTAKATNGTYTSLNIDFEKPVMTFMNNTGGPITPNGSPTCAINAVCQITPVVVGGNTGSLPLAPSVTVNGSAPVGLELDMSFINMTNTDFSVNFFTTGASSVVQLPTVQPTAELRQIDHVLGTVKTIGANQFTFTNAFGEIFTINTTGSTQFSYPPAQCNANNFTCVTVGQILDVTMSLLGNGTLSAKEIDFEDISGSSDVQGVIVTLTGSPPISFEIVAHAIEPLTVTNISVGEDTNVGIKAGATFAVDNHLFVIPAGLTFTQASNLLVGQEVLAHITGNVTAGPPALFTTDRMLLRRSQITGIVSAPPPANGVGAFNIQLLPSYLEFAQPKNISSINCDLTSQTQFDQLTPNSSGGIIVGNNVSVAGFLFPQPNVAPFVPTLATQKVRGQPLPGQ